jgi:hypothetical protein
MRRSSSNILTGGQLWKGVQARVSFTPAPFSSVKIYNDDLSPWFPGLSSSMFLAAFPHDGPGEEQMLGGRWCNRYNSIPAL